MTKKKESTVTIASGSTFSLLGKSAEIVKKHWQLFAAVSIPAILSALLSIFPSDKADNNMLNALFGFNPGGFYSQPSGEITATALLVLLLMIAVYIFFQAVTTSLAVKVTKGKRPSASEIFDEGLRYFPKFFGLAIVYSIGVVIGLILLIVPGVILFYRLIFSQYIMFDQNLGVEASLRKSWEITKGKAGLVWSAIGVMVVGALVSGFITIIPIVGVIAGTILGIAWSLVIALRYMQIRGVNIEKA